MNDEDITSKPVFYPGTPKIIQWLVRYSGGLIKDEKQANYVLIGFVILIFFLSFFLLSSRGEEQMRPLPYEQTYRAFR
jgi:hypothetical protein